MKLTRTNKSPTQVNLLISGDQYDLTPIKDHVLTHFNGRVRVPGFREGTAPLPLVEKHVDPQALNDEFIEHALNGLYGKAIDQEKLRPASRPEIKLKKFVPYTELEFEAELEVIGPLKLPGYKRIKVSKQPVEVSIKEVNDVVKSLRQRAAERKVLEQAAKDGDELVIDFAGKDEAGQPVANTDGKDVTVIIGSNMFIPGFEENLVGLKTGERKEFKVTFPKDYGVKAMQGKPVIFSVEVKKVSEVAEPKADDAFAAKAGPFKTLAELKADIKKQLKAEEEQKAQRDFDNELVMKITERAEVQVPKGLVDEQILTAEEAEKRDIVARGQTWQEHLAAEGLSEEQHRERQRLDIEKRVKASLVLSEIAEKENIGVTQEEADRQVQLLKSQHSDPQMQAELDKPENQRDIASRIMTEKTVAALVGYASN